MYSYVVNITPYPEEKVIFGLGWNFKEENRIKGTGGVGVVKSTRTYGSMVRSEKYTYVTY